jgi:hypothetical protein
VKEASQDEDLVARGLKDSYLYQTGEERTDGQTARKWSMVIRELGTYTDALI